MLSRFLDAKNPNCAGRTIVDRDRAKFRSIGVSTANRGPPKPVGALIYACVAPLGRSSTRRKRRAGDQVSRLSRVRRKAPTSIWEDLAMRLLIPQFGS